AAAGHLDDASARGPLNILREDEELSVRARRRLAQHSSPSRLHDGEDLAALRVPGAHPPILAHRPETPPTTHHADAHDLAAARVLHLAELLPRRGVHARDSGKTVITLAARGERDPGAPGDPSIARETGDDAPLPGIHDRPIAVHPPYGEQPALQRKE